jgi:hypothetical protein
MRYAIVLGSVAAALVLSLSATANATPASTLRLLELSTAGEPAVQQVNHRPRHHCRWYRGHRHCWWGPRRHRHCWRWGDVRLCARGSDRFVIRIR